MTTPLEKAIERLQQMPVERQDALAALLIHEMDEDDRWSQSTAANEATLRGLVEDVLDASRRGQCEPLDPETL